MSKSRRVGGSGWAGVYGSFIGLAKESLSGKTVRAGAKKSGKKSAAAQQTHLSLDEAGKAGLTLSGWQRQAQTQVADLERQIVSLKSQLARLQEKLRVAERSRQAAFSNADKPGAR